MLRGLVARLRAVLFRSRHEAELGEELRYHIEREVERRIAGGMTPAAARAEVTRSFGRVTEHQDDVRVAWRWQWVDELRHDIRFGLRTFRREPGLVGTVMLTVGLGVGPIAAAFTLFNAYVLRPLQVVEPEELHAVTWNSRAREGHRFTWNQFQDLTAHPAIASAVGARRFVTRVERRSASVELVTGNYFSMLGVGPALGRVIQPADAAAPGSEPVAVLNHRYWSTAFGGDSSVIGRPLRIRGLTFTIIGVTPDGFDGAEEPPPDFWAPITMAAAVEGRPDLLTDPAIELVSVTARFQADLEPAQAVSGIQTWLASNTADRPEAERAIAVTVVSRATRNPLTAEMVIMMLPIIAAFVLVFLAACANIASLLVARGVARQREIGVRLAIGAGRNRLIRQLLTESLLLALPAAAVGLIFSRLLVSISTTVLMGTLPESFRSHMRTAGLGTDYRIHLFVVIAAVGSAVIFGLLPALQATRPGIARLTRGESSDDGRPSRLRQALVIGQITVAALLLILTGVSLGSNHRARRVETGFSTEGVVVMTVTDRVRAEAVERLRARTDVRGVAATSVVPLIGASRSLTLQAAAGAPIQNAQSLAVSRDFFAVLRIDLRSGRTFGDDEAGGDAPVAIINETLARRLWGAGSALDRTFVVFDPSRSRPGAPAEPRSVRVIGVAPDVVTGWIGEKTRQPTLFLPATVTDPRTRLILRAENASAEMQLSLEETVAGIEAGSVDNVFTMDDAVRVATFPFRMASWVGIIIGLIALALTLSGVYGVMAFTVVRRTREIGVRIALGATRSIVIRMVMREMLRMAAIGIGIGAAITVAIATVAATGIEVLHPLEPLAYLAGALVVLVACVAGAAVPSRRAARVAPLEAIRSD